MDPITSLIKVKASASYESYGSEEAVRAMGRTYASLLREDNYVSLVAKLIGQAEAEEMAAISEAFEAWAENPDAFYADTWCEAVGWRA